MKMLEPHRVALRGTLQTLFLTLLTVAPLALTAVAVSAQTRSAPPGVRSGMPTIGLGVGPTPFTPPPPGPTTLFPANDIAHEARPHFAKVLILSSLGSAVGSFAGGVVGLGSQDVSGVVAGFAIGSVAGAGGGATMAGARGGAALGGALIGALAGYGVVMGLEGAGSPWISYALVQGLVTTVIAGL